MKSSGGGYSFEDLCIKRGYMRIGMKQIPKGTICVACQPPFHGDNQTPQWKMIWACGKNPEQMTNAQEIYFRQDIGAHERVQRTYDDAVQFLNRFNYQELQRG